MEVAQGRDGAWKRRAFCKGCAGALSVGLGLGSGREAAAGETGSDAGPQVLVAGDSMIAGGFGRFVERTLRKTHGYPVVRRGRSSSGLARPDFFDWKAEARRLVAARKPDASVLMFGGNDVQGLYMGHGAWIRWGEPGWDAEYARRVNALADIFAPEQQQLFWVGLPIMRPEGFRRRCAHVNRIFRAEMALRRNALFIDAWDVLCGAGRTYTASLDVPRADGSGLKRVRVRAHDGIHLSAAGARLLERHAMRKMLPILAQLG